MTMTQTEQQGDALALSVIRNAIWARTAVRRAELDVALMIGSSVADAKDLLYVIEAAGPSL
jgi:hypothetical protein